jgi:hypothetical protein
MCLGGKADLRIKKKDERLKRSSKEAADRNVRSPL